MQQRLAQHNMTFFDPVRDGGDPKLAANVATGFWGPFLEVRSPGPHVPDGGGVTFQWWPLRRVAELASQIVSHTAHFFATRIAQCCIVMLNSDPRFNETFLD